MCIGIPMQIRALDLASLRASCEAWPGLVLQQDGPQIVDLSLLGPLPVGQWVLVFLGAARECLDSERARQTGQALLALQQIQDGALSGFDHLFADLDREPSLPEHLRAQASAKENS
ncbi:HypC/HybG/HupF family hydrogenase formation chaperone [Parathalassolituus penaei]|uniref:HypC/HybG/HupF family hydrogenase formation chaperone n=1 Tax=Parathalassolituus penaei TaxID=2997323 RepID=A0A9X3EC50_9GAMM|nr:HypC/HybG/HupF family hydrogenase formation chaperone [Parathalassolituus penaei]MCY0964844.1 HypC/HybG/HupF family hydrogenase formation chaperone [Parathalassolituus penaei]